MAKLAPTLQKLRGAYYSPPEIVKFLTSWAIRSKEDKLLEPSFGDGVFLHSAYNRYKELGSSNVKPLKNMYAVELNVTESRKVRQEFASMNGYKKQYINIVNGDFFQFYNNNYQKIKFDSIVGNPPFIRYQNFDENIRSRALSILKDVGFKTSKLTNIWMPFLVASSLLLNDNGRIAMILPAEILQVKYAAELRKFLSEFFTSISIITFRKLLFPKIQQEVVLFLAEKNHKNVGINIIELEDVSELNEKSLAKIGIANTLKPVDHEQDKWLQYFLTKKEILLLRKIRKNKLLTSFGSLAYVDVGIVTGRNEFFVINKDTVKEKSLSQYVIPIISRSNQLNRAILTKKDLAQINKEGHNSNLLYPNHKKISISLKNYIREGEAKEFHRGYKCSIRSPWYNVPSVWTPDAFLLRQINKGPRLILNQTKSTSTDTIHRVKFKKETDSKSFVYCFHNSLTFAFSEIMGRSYGGGVLELEPNEAEELPIPYFRCTKKNLEFIDNAFRTKQPLENILDTNDQFLLNKKMGLSESEIKTLRKIWKKLSSRRIYRKFSKNFSPCS